MALSMVTEFQEIIKRDRMDPPFQEIRLQLPSRLNELKKIEHLSERIAKKMALSGDEQDNLSIAITEAVGNAIVHGNKKDPRKKVHIVVRMKKECVEVSVRDHGKGFNPNELSNPLDPQNVMKENGRGIFILKSLMDDAWFSFSPEGTTLTFVMKKKN